MFVVYSEYTDKDEVVPRVQELLGYAESEEEFYDYLKHYKVPEYMVFEEPKTHLPPGSLSFRISDNLSSIHLIGEVLQPLEKAKMATFPPQNAANV
jgi:hypothetical protein